MLCFALFLFIVFFAKVITCAENFGRFHREIQNIAIHTGCSLYVSGVWFVFANYLLLIAPSLFTMSKSSTCICSYMCKWTMPICSIINKKIKLGWLIWWHSEIDHWWTSGETFHLTRILIEMKNNISHKDSHNS